MEEKTETMLKYGFAAALIILGLLINHYGLGSPEFTVFGSVGNYLVYIGFVLLLINTVRQITRKKKKRMDERMEFVAAKASGVTMVFIFAGAFAVILLDGIQKITLPYHLFVSYSVCAILLVYMISYYALLRKY
jgi:uncharacterized membrane protein